MTLSIVIVNYNVRHFLDQCLVSVLASARTLADGRELELEVWVVDNNSVDGSVEMVRERFPEVRVIANKDNPGFAKANNQAIRQSNGDYVLLLNPDTVVERDTFRRCVDFFEEHADCGGLGVKMINGEGAFLKESKRGFPTPETSFYKISGLIRLFPHHRRIARYYMGHLNDDETNRVDVLPGAFLMISRAALEKVGLLDESYFMYGEDIDFSWRIKLAGYENYYLPSARIIHYKGESTKKGSMNYVYTFYNAMVIFTRRYFSGTNARIYIALIHVAIWLRAALGWLRRIGERVALPVADAVLAYGGFVAIKNLWAVLRAANVGYYPMEYTCLVIPIYIVMMLLLGWLNGGYDRPMRLGRMAKGIGMGALVLLVFYSLLDESQRYSRAVLLLGSLWTLVATLGTRVLWSALGVDGYALRERRRRGCLVVGSEEEFGRIGRLYEELGVDCESMTRVADPSRLDEMVRVLGADEVIFCSKDVPTDQIISHMQRMASRGLRYKMAPAEGDVVIGSEQINSREDLYTIELNTLASPMNRRNKRLFDFGVALVLLVVSPVLFVFQREKRRFYGDLLGVLTGRKSWVGNTEETEPWHMAGVGQGVFAPAQVLPGRRLDPERMNQRYVRDYRLLTDVRIVLRNWRNL